MYSFMVTCGVCGKTWNSLQAFYDDISKDILYSCVNDRDLRKIVWISHANCTAQEFIELKTKQPPKVKTS